VALGEATSSFIALLKCSVPPGQQRRLQAPAQQREGLVGGGGGGSHKPALHI